MKINSTIQQQLFNNPAFRAIAKAEDPNRELQRLLDDFTGKQDVAEPEKKAKVLSLGEKNTLHALFGSEKPDEYSLYGKAKLQNIHKGQLIDIRA